MTGNRMTNADSVWFLTGQIGQNESARYVPIHSTPFRIGRRADLSLCLPCKTVSGLHAEIVEQDDALLLRDLESTNGTYVNGTRVTGPVSLKQDDLVQFADVALRLRRQAADHDRGTLREDVCDKAMALVQFDKLMSERAVVPFFQPIVEIRGLKTIGYEILGRSRLFGMETPQAMFMAASQLNLEVELSRMFRWEGVQVSTSFEVPPHLFLNTHPTEMVSPGLLESMRSVREVNPTQPLTLEIHEAAVTDPKRMTELRAALADIDVRMAYDDFGAGQTRLIELIEVRPDYLKFDLEMVQGIHDASQQRQQMLSTLVRMVRELGIVPLAEGIESEGDSLACRQIGFELGQGFFYGKPAPATIYDRAG